MEKDGNKIWGTKVKENVLVRAQSASDAAVGVTAKFIHPYESPYIISRVIPPSTMSYQPPMGWLEGNSIKSL